MQDKQTMKRKKSAREQLDDLYDSYSPETKKKFRELGKKLDSGMSISDIKDEWAESEEGKVHHREKYGI